ncbi:MAG TPA: amidohydrolase family protein [Candidatus Paceibacterota bacterium]
MVLIRGGRIIDGTGRPTYEADLLLKGDKISAIGNFPRQKADLVIDALGSFIMPGFVDINTDSDHYLTLLTQPRQDGFLLQGVTTIIGGQCGSSLAPLLYGSLESIRKWANPDAINVNWHTVAELFQVLENRGLGVNFGTLVGHSTIRRALIGDISRDLTINELKVFERLLRTALNEGALGFSTGLGYALSKNTPYAELKILAHAVQKSGGIYATHLRDERGDLPAAINETVKIARETGIPVLISHFRPIKDFEKEYGNALELLEKQRGKSDMHFDGYPSDTSLVSIHTLLPQWIRHGSFETMLISAKSPHLKERILNDLPDLRGGDLIIAKANFYDYLRGKTLKEFAADQNLSLKEALLKLMLITKLRSVVLYKNINLDLAIQSLASDLAIVASNSPSFADETGQLNHERISNTFPKFLSIAVQTRLMPIEKAVQKITSIPARKLKIKNRGEIREGNFADITIMKDEKVAHVFVNGKPAVSSGRLANTASGRVLRKK